MKHRSIGKMFLLTIVTLGIYRLYWFAKTRQEMLSVHKELKIPHVIWLIAPIVTVVASVVLMITVGVMTAEDDTSLSAVQAVAMGLFYLSVFVVVPLMAIWLWKYSQAVEVVTNEKMTFAISLLILLAVPDGIDILIIQDGFNKIASPAGALPHAAAGPLPPAPTA